MHQRGEQVQDLIPLDALTRADGFGGGQIEAAAEHGQAHPQQSFLRSAQRVAPIDDAAQGVLVARLGTRHAGAAEHAEAVVEAFQHLLGCHRAQTYGCEFDGEGDAVEPSAQLGDGRAVARCNGERRSGRGGPLYQKTYGFRTFGGLLGVAEGVRVREREARHGQDVLAGYSQTVPAGGEHGQAWCGPQHPQDQGRDGVRDVFTVVQKQE